MTRFLNSCPLLVVALLLCASASGDDSFEPATLPPYSFEVVRVRIHDADTVIGDVLLPWSTCLVNQEIRAAGFDAYEVTKTRQTEPFKHFSNEEWAAEIAKGTLARDALRKLAEGGQMYVEWRPAKERSAYGRIEGALWVRTKSGQIVNVADWARESKYVRE